MSETVTPSATGARTDGTYDDLVEQYGAFLRDVVDDAGADGVVVGLSGGIDSSTAATLAVEALGTDAVYGLVLPTDASSRTNVADAKEVVWQLGINFRSIDVQPILERFTASMDRNYELRREGLGHSSKRNFAQAATSPRSYEKESMGNVAARLRMTMAYYEANTKNRLVLGTGNRTELLLGYFTKYGDGGVDCLPLGDLYKTEVRELARTLDVPDRIVEKPPTAGLWEGQTDEDELGASYETIDAVLRRLVDEGASVEETADTLSVERETVATLARMHEQSAHKRRSPPKPSTFGE